jgi:peptidoglycan/LPS O-acetylase OafA/YrhL
MIESNLNQKQINLYQDWTTFAYTMFSNGVTNIRAITNVEMNAEEYLRLFSSYMGRDGAYLALWSADYFFYCLFVTYNKAYILNDRAWDVIVNDGSIMDNLILLPIEMFGLQSVFDSLFGYTHNAGTWFISCILFCYIVFPLVYNLIKETKTKIKFFCGVVIGGILIYSPFLAEYFQLHIIYSNVFFRMIEFVIGMLLCSIWLDVNKTNWYKKYIGRKRFFFGMFFALIILVTVLVKMNIFIGNYMIYNIVALPCFVAIVFSGAGIETKIFNSSRLVKYAISISYVFFFAQLYTWDITTAIVTVLDIDTNILRIILSFVLCTIIAIIMHGIIEKPLKKVMLQKIMK